MNFKKIVSVLLVFVLAMAFWAFPVHADDVIIDYNGTSSGGGTQGSGGGRTGYLIPSVENNIDLIYGFRFSIYDGNGNKKYKLDEYGDPVNSLTIDVFVKTPSADYKGGIITQGATAQLSKKEWALNYGVQALNADGMNKYRNTATLSDLPSGSDITSTKLEEWISKKANRDTLYEKCGLSISQVEGTDYIIIEPLVAIKIANVGMLVTPTDLGMFGGLHMTTYNDNGSVKYDGFNYDGSGAYDINTYGDLGV